MQILRSEIGEVLLRSLIDGNKDRAKPMSLNIKRTGADKLRLFIANAKGEELVLVIEAKGIRVGDTLTIIDIDRTFDIKLAPAPHRSLGV